MLKRNYIELEADHIDIMNDTFEKYKELSTQPVEVVCNTNEELEALF